MLLNIVYKMSFVKIIQKVIEFELFAIQNIILFVLRAQHSYKDFLTNKKQSTPPIFH